MLERIPIETKWNWLLRIVCIYICLYSLAYSMKQRGQVEFLAEVVFTLFGLPWRRKADCKPNAVAVFFCQRSAPNGAPRTTDRRNAASSPSVWVLLTCSVQLAGMAKGPSPNQGTCVAWTRCHKLDQRQCSARATRLALSGLRST